MFFVWVLLVALLQITVLRDLNLLAVLAVLGGLRKGPVAGLLIGVFIGAVNGIFSVSGFGLSIVLYGMVGFLSGLARARIFYKETVATQIVFSFCGLFLFYSAYFILTSSMNVFILPTLLFSALVSPVVFRIIEI